MCRFEPSYLAVTICKDSESSAKGHRLPHDKKRLDSAYCNRGQKCKAASSEPERVELALRGGGCISNLGHAPPRGDGRGINLPPPLRASSARSKLPYVL